MTIDQRWMSLALAEARLAAAAQEVPIGAVLVYDGQVIGRGHNHCIRHCDPSAHAEIIALRAAGQHFGDWRMEDCTLYVTLEPCPMCMGACLNGRVKRVVYGAAEPKAGACGSIVDLRAPAGFNHQIEVEPGVLGDESAALLQGFFRDLRQRGRRPSHAQREDGCSR